MNTRRLMLAFGIALLCSGLLTWQLSRHLPRETSRERPHAIWQVVIAGKDIHEGDPLADASLTVVPFSSTQPLAGVFQNTSSLLGRTVQVSIPSGEPILAHDLAPVGAGSGLAVTIPPGMRAVSVHALEDAGTNAGFIIPGSHVDLLVTYRTSDTGVFVSSVVLQNVHVLAVGQSREAVVEEKFHSDGSITLLLTPDQAARLMAASSLGKLTLALRNGMDRAVSTETLRVEFDGVSRAQTKQPLVERPRRQMSVHETKRKSEFQVETLAGGKSTVQVFRGDQ